MGRLPNLVLGSIATALIATGVAAQTGTIQLPRLTGGAAGAGGNAVAAPAEASPSPAVSPSPSPSPSPALAPSPPPVTSATVSAVVQRKPKGHGH